ncbi:MAG: DUF4268 domain-containing protein [Myxococcota bacterium]
MRDQKERIGLADSDSFVRFVKRDLDFYAKRELEIRRAAGKLTEGLEAIRYNEDRGFTLQSQLLLAPLLPEDSPEVIRRKLQLVGDFVDIWLARRTWNFRTIAYSSVRYTIFTMTRAIRGLSVDALSQYLREQLAAQGESFASEPQLRLHQQNYRQIRHILARLTHWVDTQCGAVSHFEDLISQGRARPFEIEHIWANHYEQFAHCFTHPAEFDKERNRIGGLLLIQRGVNQSLGDAAYKDKRDAYLGHSANLLARSLHPGAYQSNPAFKSLLSRTGLEFRPYDEFGHEQQSERQELYIRIAEWVWNPSRLDLDGEKPPEHEPIHLHDEPDEDTSNHILGADQVREQRFRFWTKLLEQAAKTGDHLHRNVSARRGRWLGARKHGQWWNYVVLQHEMRVELYIDSKDAMANKELFDRLLAQKDEVENQFGSRLDWQRMPEKRASRISYALPSGWVNDERWTMTADQAVDAMRRLFATFGAYIEEGDSR